MVEISLIASTVLMGLLLVVVGAGVASGRDWRAYSLARRVEVPSTRRVVESEAVWVLGFFVLVFGAVAAAVVFVSDLAVPDPVRQAAGLGVVAVLVAALLLYLLWGVYSASRHRGFHHAASVGMAAFVAGLLFLLLVVLKLFEVV